MSVTSTSLPNVTSWMTLDNLFLLFRCRQVLVVTITRLDTISRAVSCNSLLVTRTLRYLTVGKMLSIGLYVRRYSQR